MKLKEASVFNQKKENGLISSSLTTKWSQEAAKGNTWKEYPRPSMIRKYWFNLNGWWDYAITFHKEFPEVFDGKILVPFSPESTLSHVNRQLQPDEYLWYQKEICIDELAVSENKLNKESHHVYRALPEGWHYLLHFGAVDQECEVYIDHKLAGKHKGGYLPFTVDCFNKDHFIITVCVKDVSDTSFHSRGKQKLKRGGMYYTAQSGLWQSVWMEAVPEEYIESVHFDGDVDQSQCLITLKTNRTTVYKSLKIRNVHLWSTEDPFLYHITLKRGQDQVQCYFAMRKLSIEKSEDGFNRFCLNGKPLIQTGVLDQGYWCDGLYTAPSDEALIYDIETMKDLGFNVLRKHIKIEPERWYYHCDRLGMLVWQDMVNGGSQYKDWFVTYLATALNIHHIPVLDGKGSRYLLSRMSKEGRDEYLKELEHTIDHLKDHPSIVLWVPFNEGWGQFDARKVTKRIKELDPTRFIDSASGWFDQKCGDVMSLHHYFFKLHFKPESKRVLALSEFGGYTWQVDNHTFNKALYGYGTFNSKEDLSQAFASLYKREVIETIPKGMSAFIYTQLSDIEDETNGIVTYDRKVIKLDEKMVRYFNKKIKESISL